MLFELIDFLDEELTALEDEIIKESEKEEQELYDENFDEDDIN